jgi:hypothetical protein
MTILFSTGHVYSPAAYILDSKGSNVCDSDIRDWKLRGTDPNS